MFHFTTCIIFIDFFISYIIICFSCLRDMSQTYFVKGLIGKVLAYGGLQIRTSLPHGLQIPADITILLKDTCSRGSPAPRVI